MKKTLLAGIAVLLLGTGAVHADGKLPEYMLGRWCSDYLISTKSVEVYYRPDHADPNRCCCGDSTDGITINSEGYTEDGPGEDPVTCLFDKVEEKDRNIYLIHLRCKLETGIDFSSVAEFQLINDLLFVKVVSES
jgi:hypothetical protein